MYIVWPTMEEVQKENDRSTLIAIACHAWGNCHLEKPPAYFGAMMVLIGQKIERLPHPPILQNWQMKLLQICNPPTKQNALAMRAFYLIFHLVRHKSSPLQLPD